MHIHGIFRQLNTSVGRRDISNKNNISDISNCVSCGVYNALHVYSTQTRRSKGEKWKVLKLYLIIITGLMLLKRCTQSQETRFTDHQTVGLPPKRPIRIVSLCETANVGRELSRSKSVDKR